jgi:hypothetical protein
MLPVPPPLRLSIGAARLSREGDASQIPRGMRGRPATGDPVAITEVEP